MIPRPLRLGTALLCSVASVRVASAQLPATWKQIGPTGAYRNTLGINGMNGRFYSIENDGTLYVSDLSGAWKQIGKSGDYAGTTMLLAMGSRFYNIQRGTMYATDPSDGSWSTVAPSGSWANTAIMVGMDGYIWSIEANGTLFRTDRNGNYVQLDAGRLHPQMLAAMGERLWALEDGALWSLVPGEHWDLLGTPGDFEDARWFIATTGYLWELDQDGTLYRGDANDHWTQVGKDHEFQRVRFLVALGAELYLIRDGTLYRITW